MNCPNCNLEISEIDIECPFCKHTVLISSNDDYSENEQQNEINEITEISQTIQKDSLDFNDTESESQQEYRPNDDDSNIDMELSEQNCDIPFNREIDVSAKLNQNDNKVIPEDKVSSNEKHNNKINFIEKLLIFLSGKKENPIENLSSEIYVLNILSSFPLLFWIPYVLKKKPKSVLFFANQSFKLTILLMINSVFLLVFELIPFYKTVDYLNNGIMYFSVERFVPSIVLIFYVFLSVFWLIMFSLNLYCSTTKKLYNFLPFKSLKIIR